MNILSLFDGISCGYLALKRAKIPVENYYAYEIDKYALKVSTTRFPQIQHFGDVRGADFSCHKNIDLLFANLGFTLSRFINSKAKSERIEW